MATQTQVSCPSLSNSHHETQLYWKIFKFLLAQSIMLAVALTTDAQTPPQQYVYDSGSLSSTSSVLSGFSKASTTGALSSIPGSPFNERFEGGLVAIDGQGKFLFVLNPKLNKISMFQINPASGALSEVHASPFQVPPTINPNLAPSQPVSIATERSGNFLFVGYYLGDIQGSSSVVSLAINTSGPSPVLVTQQSTELTSGAEPLQLFTDPKGLRLYVGLNHGQNSLQIAGAEVYSIDQASGALTYLGTSHHSPGDGLSYAIDPGNRFMYVGYRGNFGYLDSCMLSPVDGTALVPCSSLQLAFQDFPTALVAENSGKFLYVTQVGGTFVYSINQTTGALTQALSPLANIFFFGPAGTVADPMGPYIYSVLPQGIHAYQVDQLSGNLTEISGSPFSAGMVGVVGALGLAISGTPVQAISGPAATIFPSTGYSGGSVVVGSSGQTGVFSLVNTGGQSLAINSFSIAGPNASSFSQSHTCLTTLAPNANCSISIDFMPAAVGALSATLQIADNAPGSPQTLSLTGTGLAPSPAVTLVPGSLDFGTVIQGTSTPLNVTVTNAGTAALHIANITLGGTNTGDFSLFAPSCNIPISVNASCTITVTFKPLAVGLRTASLALTDDATNSPQAVSLTGNANTGPSPAVTVNPSSPDFGSTTQGTSAQMNIIVKNAGTAVLHISGAVLGGANVNEFSFSDPTCNAAIPVSATCTIVMTFMPLATGPRVASVTLTDDAPDSPQTISIKGMANPALSVSVAPGGSTTASVSAGQTAQYQLQLTPGPGYSGTVSLACSGAPLNATCQVPTSVAIANGAPSPFTVTVSTKGGAMLPSSMPWHFVPPPARIRVLPLLAFALLLVTIAGNRWILGGAIRARRLARSGVLAALLLGFVIHAAGCGSSGVTTTPPPIITPPGTSTIIITMTAMSFTQQPLQLPPLQLTLTVK